LGIEHTWRYQIYTGHNGSEHRIIVFIKTNKDIGDKLIITKRSSGGSKLISILTHLGIVIYHEKV
jgi:hypothetical protein